MAIRGRSVRKTVLVVCEGKRDKAFVEYLRSLYTSGDPASPKVDVKEARGKGADHVITTLVGTLSNKSYDVGVAFTDADLPPTAAKRNLLFRKRKNFTSLLVQADPCLEGLLLAILDRRVHPKSDACKDAFEMLTSKDLYSSGHFSEVVPYAALEVYLAKVAPHDSFYSFVQILKLRA